MASSKRVVDYIAKQLGGAGIITIKKMFEEYGVYCDNKFIGVICDDTLFIKPTKLGLKHCGEDAELVPAYDGAKPNIVIKDKQLEEIEWITKLIFITYKALPQPKPKK